MYSQEEGDGEFKSTYEQSYSLGEFLFHIRQYRKAIDSYTEALELNPGGRECLASRARCHLILGNCEEALQDAEDSLKEDRNYHRGIQLKADALYLKADFETALVFYHRGYRLKPESEGFRLGIQKAREAIHNAVGCPERVRLSKAGDLSYFEELAEANKRTKRQPVRRTMLTLSPSEELIQTARKPDIKRLLEEMYGDCVYLESLLNDPVTTGPPQIKSLVMESLGYLNSRAEFWRQQKRIQQEASRGKGQDEVTLKTIGVRRVKQTLEHIEALQHAGQTKDVLRRCNKVLTTVNKWAPDVPQNEMLGKIYSYMGIAHQVEGSTNKAIESFERDLTLGRDNKILANQSRALLNLGQLYTEIRKFQDAVAVWGDAIDVSMSDAESMWMYHELGHCYHELGNGKEAYNCGNNCYKLARCLGERRWQMNGQILMGQSNFQMSKFPEAHENFKEAQHFCAFINDAKAKESIDQALMKVGYHMEVEIIPATDILLGDILVQQAGEVEDGAPAEEVQEEESYHEPLSQMAKDSQSQKSDDSCSTAPPASVSKSRSSKASVSKEQRDEMQAQGPSQLARKASTEGTESTTGSSVPSEAVGKRTSRASAQGILSPGSSRSRVTWASRTERKSQASKRGGSLTGAAAGSKGSLQSKGSVQSAASRKSRGSVRYSVTSVSPSHKSIGSIGSLNRKSSVSPSQKGIGSMVALHRQSSISSSPSRKSRESRGSLNRKSSTSTSPTKRRRSSRGSMSKKGNRSSSSVSPSVTRTSRTVMSVTSKGSVSPTGSHASSKASSKRKSRSSRHQDVTGQTKSEASAHGSEHVAPAESTGHPNDQAADDQKETPAEVSHTDEGNVPQEEGGQDNEATAAEGENAEATKNVPAQAEGNEEQEQADVTPGKTPDSKITEEPESTLEIDTSVDDVPAREYSEHDDITMYLTESERQIAGYFNTPPPLSEHSLPATPLDSLHTLSHKYSGNSMTCSLNMGLSHTNLSHKSHVSFSTDPIHRSHTSLTSNTKKGFFSSLRESVFSHSKSTKSRTSQGSVAGEEEDDDLRSLAKSTRSLERECEYEEKDLSSEQVRKIRYDSPEIFLDRSNVTDRNQSPSSSSEDGGYL